MWRSRPRSAPCCARARPEARVDRVALDHYLACRFVPAPRTLFEGIQKLPAATTLVVEENGAPRLTGWREAPGPHVGGGDDELAEQLAERYADAVERQMMSDVPYGAFLSGGVDSAAIAAAMRLRSDAPPTTFTIGFPGHGDVVDERALAAETARLVGTDHRETVMVETDFLTELARCMPRLEEPCGIPSAPALLQLSRFAAKDVKVVLAGQGADEPHGGYGRHKAAALLAPLRLVPAAVAAPAAAVARALPRAGERAPARARARRPRRRRTAAEARGDHGRRGAHVTARPRRRGGAGAARHGARASSPTCRAAGCSSRRSTSTRACSCRTGS